MAQVMQTGSPHTIASYRDTFRLLVRHARKVKKAPTELELGDLDTDFLGAFLSHLEVRIPAEVDRRIRSKWIAESGRSGSPNPAEVDRFRTKWITHSGHRERSSVA